MSQSAGKTILIDYFDCSIGDIKNLERIKSEILSVCPSARPFELVRLEGGGIMGAIQLQDGIFTLHTDPERRFAALEITVFGEKEFDFLKIIRRLKKAFGSRNFFTMEVKRGMDVLTQGMKAPAEEKVPGSSSRKDG